MLCPKCGGTMKIIDFITEYAVVDRIIDYMKLTFVAAKPPPSHVFSELALMAAEESRRTIFHDRRFREGREVYHLLEYFAVVRNVDLSGRRELRPFLVLDIDQHSGISFSGKGWSRFRA